MLNLFRVTVGVCEDVNRDRSECLLDSVFLGNTCSTLFLRLKNWSSCLTFVARKTSLFGGLTGGVGLM